MASGSQYGGVNGATLQLRSADNALIASTSVKTEGLWRLIQLELTNTSFTTLILELGQESFRGDTYWDDVLVERIDGLGGGGAWSSGWTSFVAPGGPAATWSLSPTGGLDNGPTRRVTVTAGGLLGDLKDTLVTSTLRNGSSYVISVWASASVAGTTIDFSLRDSAGNVLPMDLPTSCKLNTTLTLCQNALTYGLADGVGQLTLLYGGQGLRDVYVAHPLVAPSSTLRDYTSAGQVTRVYDLFGHETRTDYDGDSLYPAVSRRRVASTYRDVVMIDAPVAYWRLGESTGTVAADSAGANQATIQGGVALAQPGALWGDPDRAFTFDGVGGYLSIPDAPALASAQTTVEAWIKVDAWVTNASIYNRRTAANVGGVTLELGAPGEIKFFVYVGSTFSWATVGGVTMGAWHHLAGTYDGQNIRLYVDGTLGGSTAVAGVVNNPASPLVQIGHNITGPYYVNGSIDEVAVYGTALSATRLLAHYQSGRAQGFYVGTVVPDAPAAYWRLGEAAGSVAADQSGSNAGAYLGSVTLGRSGAILGDAGTATRFDGSTGYVQVPYTAALNPSLFAVEAWAYVTGGAGTFRSVITSQNVTGVPPTQTDSGYSLVAGVEDTWQVYVGNGTVGFVGVYGPSVVLNRWTHLVATYNGTTLTLYVDGALGGSQLTAYTVNNVAPLRIGAGATEGPADLFFPGLLQEVAVYPRALPAAAVLAHFRAGQAGGRLLQSGVEYNSVGQLVSSTGIDPSNGTRITDRQELDSWGRSTAEIRNFRLGVAADSQTNVRTGRRYDLNGNETDRYALGPSSPSAIPLYLTAVNDSLLTTARQLSTTAPVGESGSNTSLGTATGWGELASQGSAAAWPAGATAPAPSGRGFLWNVTTLEGQQLLTGTWAPTLKLNAPSAAAGALVADVQVRAFVRSTAGTYTAIGSITLLGQSIDNTSRTFVLPGTILAAVNFGAGDKLYTDVLLRVSTNTMTDGLAVVTLFMNSAAATEQVVMPGYAPWVTTHSDYDLNGNRTRQVLNQVSAAPETASQNVTTLYTFSALNQLTDERRPALSAGGSTVRHTVYDNARRPIQVTENYVVGPPPDAQTNVATSFEYDRDGRMTATTNPLGVRSTRSYDAMGRLITELMAATAPPSIAAAPAQTDWTLDLGGRVTDTLGPGTGNPAVRIRTHVDYDALGRQVAVTRNADGAGGLAAVTTRAAFDPRGATTVTSPATQRQTPGGVPTRTELDLAGRSIGVIRNSLALSPAADIKVTTLTAYDNFGRPSDGTDSRGFVTHTDYDALGRPSAVTLDPGSLPHLNLTTTYGYSVAGDLVSVGRPRDGGPRTDRTEFDALHRPTASVLNYVGGGPLDWQTNIRTETTYDAQGRVLTLKDPLGRISRTDYDLLGRRVALTSNCVDALGVPCGAAPTSDQNVRTSWTVDAAGRVTAELSPRTGGSPALNLTTAYSYDAQGRLVQVVEDSGTGHLNLATVYGYDPAGNRLTTTDGRSNVTTVTVDPLGRLVKLQDASGYFTQTQYSPAGEVTATINARNQTNAATLDRLGRVTTQNYLKADGVTAASLTYTYDAAGNVTTFQSTDTGATTITYDPLGRVQSVTGPSATTYVYFQDGTISSIAEATGTTTFTEDQLGRVRTAQDPLSGVTTSTGYTFDAGSRLTQRMEANGLVSVFSYSGLDQLNWKTIAVGTNPAFASWTNTYDYAGNRQSEAVVLPTDPIAGTASFTYDLVQQLATATFPTQAQATYGYDPAHNRTTVSGATFAFLPNNAINTEGAIPYAPDADGNQTKDAPGRGFKYDSLNRLEQVTDAGGGLQVSYVYDARGRLVKRTAGASVLQLLYRGLEDQVVQEQDGAGTVLRNYAWDTRGRRLLMQIPGATPLLYALLNNPHGDVVGLVDGTGAVAGTVHYNAWGQLLGQTGTQIPFGFQGGFTDPLTGWARMGVRWYDPRLGRFTSSDPLAPAADLLKPLAAHRWLYAYNSPLRYSDLTGLRPPPEPYEEDRWYRPPPEPPAPVAPPLRPAPRPYEDPRWYAPRPPARAVPPPPVLTPNRRAPQPRKEAPRPSAHPDHPHGPGLHLPSPGEVIGAGLTVWERELKTKTVRVRAHEQAGRVVHAYARHAPGALAKASAVSGIGLPLAVVTSVEEAAERHRDLPPLRATGAIAASALVHFVVGAAVAPVIAVGVVVGAAAGSEIPVVGTAAGAIVGGVVAGAAGIGASMLITDWFDDRIHSLFAGP